MANVNLTPRQQKFFDYFMNYHAQNGVFPTMSQGSRDLKVAPTTICNMYGALLLKGTFTNGKALVSGNRPRRNATDIRAVSVADMKFEAKANLRKRHTSKAIAQQIAKLIASGDPAAKKLAEMLGL